MQPVLYFHVCDTERKSINVDTFSEIGNKSKSRETLSDMWQITTISHHKITSAVFL